MTDAWHETFAERLDDDYAPRPVPHREPAAGATCILTAGGSPPDAIEQQQIAEFKRYLGRRRAAGLGPNDPDTPETVWKDGGDVAEPSQTEQRPSDAGLPTLKMTTTVRMVLTVLHSRDGQELWGFRICELTGLDSGTVYPILARLGERGWATSQHEVPQPNTGRPLRRYWRLTPAAKARLDEETSR